jgi:peptidoglycan/xylan/chitin deacetylase (PgdA/CDA1 family)
MSMFDVTLSFDNGPEPSVTPAVLETLAREGIAASFFVLGNKLADRERRSLAQRAAAEGHWIGNHTYSHATPLGQRAEPDAPEVEIGRTQALIGNLSHPGLLFRPNGGGGHLNANLLSRRALAYLVDGRYSCVLWNAVPRDWEDADGWVERALGQCRALPWSLVVLHDLPTGAMRHLARFIGEVREGGGRFRQEFPPDCVPLRGGEIALPMDRFVSEDLPAKRQGVSK